MSDRRESLDIRGTPRILTKRRYEGRRILIVPR
jgi:hypothetical protein